VAIGAWRHCRACPICGQKSQVVTGRGERLQGLARYAGKSRRWLPAAANDCRVLPAHRGEPAPGRSRLDSRASRGLDRFAPVQEAQRPTMADSARWDPEEMGHSPGPCVLTSCTEDV
jgi:hypothetical protein